jgi:hypothetical protein
MHLIGSRFRLHEHDGAVAAAELGRIGIRDDLKLPDGRERGALAVLILGGIVVVDAVDLERDAARAGAVEVDGRSR